MHTKAGRATKKTKKTKHPAVSSAKKKMPMKKGKASSNAKLGTDKKMEKFWEDIHFHYNELVTTSNKINESNAEYFSVECCNIESLRNCWQRRIQPAA